MIRIKFLEIFWNNRGASSTASVFLDISSRVLSGGERGSLGLAFRPQFSLNGRFFRKEAHPISIADWLAGVKAGLQVDLSVQDGDLVVRAVKRRTYRLRELLEQVTAKNLHGEVDTDEPVGREVW